MLQFKVVCFKKDIGIFTGYGAKIKTVSPTPGRPPHPPFPGPGHPHPGTCHIPADPRFIDKVYYEVVVYTNTDLTQSITIYQDKNIYICRLVLNNFIKMCLNGMNIIDLDTINDKHPIHLCENYNDKFDGHPPFENPWDKCWKDPRKNPYFDIYDCQDKPFGEKFHEGVRPREDECMYERDYDHHPVPDGDVISFHPHKPDCHPPQHHHHGIHEDVHDIERSVTRVIPNQLDRILHEVTPPEIRPENKHRIVFYFGNGGFSMGESVTDSIVEISEHALKDMLEKNHRPTFSNMNPRDTINIQRYIRDSIYPQDVFDTFMDIAGEWCFIMVPDKYYKLIKDFNWYYQDESTDNQWIEAPLEMSETTFTIQDNGVRYFINAIRFNGDYAVRFAKSGRTMTGPTNCTPPMDPFDHREIDPDMRYRVTLTFKNSLNQNYYLTIKDVTDTENPTKPIKIKFNTMDTAWVDAIPNKIYEIDKVTTENDEESYTAVKFFKVIENHNFKKGFSVWVSDVNEVDSYVDTKSDIVFGIIE